MEKSNYPDNCSQTFHCNDCDYETHIQSRLSLHRVKKHPHCIDDNIKSINVVVKYPKGKSFYCCICDTIIGSLANFRRHCQTSHPKIPFKTSCLCTICDTLFDSTKGAGVHLKGSHKLPSSFMLNPPPDEPIISFVDYHDSNKHLNSK